MCVTWHGHLQDEMEHLRGDDQEDRGRCRRKHPQHRVARLLHRDIGRIAQLGDGRPIPQHHHERLHLQGGICGTWLSTRVAKPQYGRFRHGNLRTRALDCLRYDTEHRAWHPDIGISALLLLQHHQPIDELLGSDSRFRTEASEIVIVILKVPHKNVAK